MMRNKNRDEALLKIMKDFKDAMHRDPELSFQEFQTTRRILDALEDTAVEAVDFPFPTGVIGILRGGKTGGTVALRADIDAIEQTENPAHEVVSENPGVMHACGHDFHTASLIGAAHLLSGMKEEIKGDVLFIFQPGEEVTKGAGSLIERGLFERFHPDALFGIHNRPEIEAGKVAVMEGPVMAGKNHFRIEVSGKTGHGGSPHKCSDVILCAAQMITALQSVVSRSTDPLDSVVLSVLSIHSGTEENFVPEKLSMTGSIRSLSGGALRHAEERLDTICTDIADLSGCRVRIEHIEDVPVTENRGEIVITARKAAARAAGEANILSPRPDMGSEDFASYQAHVPSFFYWVGSGIPGERMACWHNEDFRTDDRALLTAARVYAASALEALNKIPDSRP